MGLHGSSEGQKASECQQFCHPKRGVRQEEPSSSCPHVYKGHRNTSFSRSHFRNDPCRRSSTKEEETAMVGTESPPLPESRLFVFLLKWIRQRPRSSNSMKRISVLILVVIYSYIMTKPTKLLLLSKYFYLLRIDFRYILFLHSSQGAVFWSSQVLAFDFWALKDWWLTRWYGAVVPQRQSSSRGYHSAPCQDLGWWDIKLLGCRTEAMKRTLVWLGNCGWVKSRSHTVRPYGRCFPQCFMKLHREEAHSNILCSISAFHSSLLRHSWYQPVVSLPEFPTLLFAALTLEKIRACTEAKCYKTSNFLWSSSFPL